MASEDDDMDLDALRSAVLATLKTKNSQNASPPLNNNTSLRDTDIETLRIAALHSARPPDVPVQKYHPYPSRRGGFHREYGPPKSVFNMHMPFAHRPAPSNLIVIQPVPIQQISPTLTVPTSSQPATNEVFLSKPPQDRSGRSTEDEASQSPSGQKSKRVDKFSRFESDTESDSDDDYFLGKSDETNNDESSSSAGDDEQVGNGEEDEGGDEEETSREPDLVDVLLLHTNELIAEEEMETPPEDVCCTPTVASGNSPVGEVTDANEKQSPDQPSGQDPVQRDSRETSYRRSDRRGEDRQRGGGDRLPPRREREGCATASDRNRDMIRHPTTKDTDSDNRQRAIRGERFGGVRPDRRRENRIRDDNGARNGPRPRVTGRTEQSLTKGTLSGDHKSGGNSNYRRRAVSPPLLPLASSAARHNGERHEPMNGSSSARNVSAEPAVVEKKSSSSRRLRVSVKKSTRGEADGGGPLNDLREKLKFRNREAVLDGPVLDRQRRRKEVRGDCDSGGGVPSPPRDLAARLERRNRSRSPFRRARALPLQSIVKIQHSSGSRSLGGSPARSPGHASMLNSETSPSSTSKRTQSPAFVERTESLNPRKVLIMKEKNYDDMLSSRHRFNVAMTEAPDLPDSDSTSINNRLPIHLRLGHFAKSSSATFDVPAPAESRHSSRSSSERKTSSRQSKKKSRSRKTKDEGSPLRQVKLKRESFHSSPPPSSSVVSFTASRVASTNGLSSKRSQKHSGRTYESELDEKIRRIKEVNEAIMKRKSEIEKDQQANY